MKKLSHKQISRLGGLATKAKLGKDHYKAMGKKGSQTVLEKYGKDYYKKLSQAGMRARVAKYLAREKAEKNTLDKTSGSMVD